MFDFIKAMTERSWFAWVVLFIMGFMATYYLYSFFQAGYRRIIMERNKTDAIRNGIQGTAIVMYSNLTPDLQDVLVNNKKVLI